MCRHLLYIAVVGFSTPDLANAFGPFKTASKRRYIFHTWKDEQLLRHQRSDEFRYNPAVSPLFADGYDDIPMAKHHRASQLGLSSSSNDSHESSSPSTTSLVPSYRTLLVFLSTTIVIWLSEPLLGLVDTTVVGLSASTVQLASMGPSVTMMDSLFYLTYFLSIATTNRIAAERSTNNVVQLQRTTSHVLAVSVFLGALVTATCLLACRPILTSMCGVSGSVELIGHAVWYVRIRACTAICAVTGITMQSILLASLDTKTPALAVAAASVTNVLGDLAFRKQGVRGAAMATAAASLVSASILFRACRKQMLQWRRRDDSERIPMMSLPDRTSAVQLITLAGPIFFVIVAKIACYGAMTLRCTDFGVHALAAQSIMMRIFFFFGCFGDSVSQTAQSFLPATLYPVKSRGAFNVILRRLVALATGIGILNCQCSILILKRLGQYLTKDGAIVELMRNHSGFMGLSILLHPFIMLLEGTVISSRDFSTLIYTYTATLGLHFGILKYFAGSFPAVWRTFFLFQTTRLTLYASRVWWKTNRESSGAA